MIIKVKRTVNIRDTLNSHNVTDKIIKIADKLRIFLVKLNCLCKIINTAA